MSSSIANECAHCGEEVAEDEKWEFDANDDADFTLCQDCGEDYDKYECDCGKLVEELENCVFCDKKICEDCAEFYGEHVDEVGYACPECQADIILCECGCSDVDVGWCDICGKSICDACTVRTDWQYEPPLLTHCLECKAQKIFNE